MKRLLIIMLFVTASAGIATFVGCGVGGSGSGSSSPLSGLLGEKGLSNFFVDPIHDSVVASATAFNAYSLLSSALVDLFIPADIGAIQEITATAGDLPDFSKQDFINKDCRTMTKEFPLGKLPGQLPTWFTQNTPSNDRSNDGDYNLGVMGEFSFAFLLDVHCHGLELFDLNQKYTSEPLSKSIKLDTKTTRRVPYDNYYVSHKESEVGITWAKEDGFYVGAMRFDLHLCSRAPSDHYDAMTGLFPDGECEEPATSNKFKDGEDSFQLTTKYSIHKKEKEEDDGTETRFIQLITRFNQKLNYQGYYCNQVLDSVHQASQEHGVVNITSYAKLSVTEDGSSDDYSCGDLLDSDYTGHNNFTVTQYLDLDQSNDGTSILYRCDNTGDYDMQINAAVDDAFWKTYPSWCYENTTDADQAPLNDYDYSTDVITAQYSDAGSQVGDATRDAYSFPDQDKLFGVLEKIEDGDFNPDDLTTTPLWEW